jgi:hypothetical protein
MNNKIEILTLNEKNINDFAALRNKLMSNAKSKWVLFLDSDEKLTTPIKHLPGNHKAYEITRRNYFLGKFVGTEKIVRLGLRSAGLWKRIVHEYWDVDKKFLGNITDSEIIHNTSDSLGDYINKINKYSDLHALANNSEGKRSSIVKIVIFPLGKFLVTLVRSKNLVFSIMQSLHSFISWAKLYFLQH